MIVYRLFNLSSGKIAVFFFLEFSDRQGVTSWPPAPGPQLHLQKTRILVLRTPYGSTFYSLLTLFLLCCTFVNLILKFLSILRFSLKISMNTFSPGDTATRGNSLCVEHHQHRSKSFSTLRTAQANLPQRLGNPPTRLLGADSG